MKKFFKSHHEIVLVGLTVLFLAVLIVYFFWGITTLILNLNKALTMGGEKQSEKIEFDIKGAEALDLKGLAQ